MHHQLQSCRPRVSGLRNPGPRYVGERVAVTGAAGNAAVAPAVPARLLLPSCGQSVIGWSRSTSSSDWQIKCECYVIPGEIGLSRDLRSLKPPTLATLPQAPSPAVPTHSTWKLFCMQIQALCSIFYVSEWRARSVPDWEFCARVHFGVTFNDCQQFWTCRRIFEAPELAQIANSSCEKSCEMWKVLLAKVIDWSLKCSGQ